MERCRGPDFRRVCISGIREKCPPQQRHCPGEQQLPLPGDAHKPDKGWALTSFDRTVITPRGGDGGGSADLMGTTVNQWLA